jgi:hypothetical protein
MTIAEYLIKCINNGLLSKERPGYVNGMGELWKFVPDRKYGPGILINFITGNVLSVAELSDREIDYSYNDWQVVS